eukprot:GHVT01008191.1.p1 GENE.GHVT01008191.1~~GHVT01008191.1.p1  ORF type:complete len:130 (+),score=8.89 GHVT01008191.1:730-1119(+)
MPGPTSSCWVVRSYEAGPALFFSPGEVSIRRGAAILRNLRLPRCSRGIEFDVCGSRMGQVVLPNFPTVHAREAITACVCGRGRFAPVSMPFLSRGPSANPTAPSGRGSTRKARWSASLDILLNEFRKCG